MADETETAVAENTEGAGETEDAPRRKKNRTPDGQTASGSAELGGDPDADFTEPVTRVSDLGEAKPTRIRKNGESDGDVPKLFTGLTKALGHKPGDLLSFNERSRVAVYANGGKYQVSKNGKSLRHLAGPLPPADLKLDVRDARFRSPFTGTAAALNAPAAQVEQTPNQKRAEREELRARLEVLDDELGDED
jgi:hypothetical protein